MNEYIVSEILKDSSVSKTFVFDHQNVLDPVLGLGKLRQHMAYSANCKEFLLAKKEQRLAKDDYLGFIPSTCGYFPPVRFYQTASDHFGNRLGVLINIKIWEKIDDRLTHG